MVCHLLYRGINYGARISSRRTRAAGGVQVQRAHLNCAVSALLDQDSARLSRLRSVLAATARHKPVSAGVQPLQPSPERAAGSEARSAAK